MLIIHDIYVSTPLQDILKGVSITLNQGEAVGLTGKSGAGKTTLIKAIMGFLYGDCKLTAGRICLDEKELTGMSAKERRNICGTTIGYIPQSPMTAFDPRLKIGVQMTETFHRRLGIEKDSCLELADDCLNQVNLSDSKRILASTPRQLSGGMLQRIAMAVLIAMKPDYVLADEATSALDADNRDMILELLQSQCKNSGILFISHDVAALSSLCKKVIVLAEGKVAELGSMDELLQEPKSQWTKEFARSYFNTGRGEWEWNALQ